MTTSSSRALFITQILTALNLNAFVVKKKRLRAWLATAGLTLALTPSYAGIASMQVLAFAFLRKHGLPLEDLLLTGLYAAGQIVLLIAAIPIVYSSLYQSNELSILLPLPYRPWQIVAAKLGAIYIPELLLGWAFFLPGLITYYAYGYASPLHLPVTLVGLMFMPVIPLALSSIVCILVANIPGIGRSRWFWYIGITLALVGVSFLPMMAMSADDPGMMSDLVQIRMRQISHLARLMPGVQYAMYALVGDTWMAALQQLVHLVIVAAYAVAVLGIGNRFYIGPILRGTPAANRRSAQAERAQERGILASLIRKELLCTLKDPAVAMNGLGGYIALPLLAVTYTVLKYQTRGKVDIIGQIDKLLHSEAFSQHLPFFVVGIALALAMFGSMSSLFAASYSKDGKRLWVEKSLPLPPFAIYLGKFWAAFLMISALNLLTVAVFSLAIPIRAHEWSFVVALSEAVIAWSGAGGLAIDAVRPKLVWKDTVQAVKQNMNVVLGLGVTMAGLGLNVLLLWRLYQAEADPWFVYAGAMALNLAFLVAAFVAGRRAAERLRSVMV